jgi:hypothetical protein
MCRNSQKLTVTVVTVATAIGGATVARSETATAVEQFQQLQ